jgi:tetratricopeptide (TPR) repeat protein
MAEDFEALDPGSSVAPLDKVQLCLDGVREAECFVAIITKRHGSEILIRPGETVPTSYFEIELFEAALLQKPSFIFLRRGYQPDPKLATLLKLLKPFFPNMDLNPVSEDTIRRHVDRLVRHYERPRWLRPLLRPPDLRETVRALARVRHRRYSPRTETPPMRFLDGSFDAQGSPRHPDLIEHLLQRAAMVKNRQERFTLLWLALRALMETPFTDPIHASLRNLWDRALGAWNSAGAWYGLHGHLELGCLAALGSLTDVRKLTGLASPHGALASEYYSIAGLAGNSRQFFGLALDHVNEALAVSQGQPSGELAIRASIYRSTGNLDAAVNDYQAVVLQTREKGPSAYGDALSELGYAQMLKGNVRQGICHMEEGLELLNKEQASGFTIRAMRKLALGYARRGAFVRALDLSASAYDLAMELGAYDQIRRLERLAHRLDRRRIFKNVNHWL